jgi:hypothetical protein
VFRVPDTPSRERLAMELGSKVNHKRHAPSAAFAAAAAASAAAGTPGSFVAPSPRTPRGAGMSPAAQRLLGTMQSRTRRTTAAVDWQLRSSYKSPAAAAASGTTPKRAGACAGDGGECGWLSGDAGAAGVVTPGPQPSPAVAAGAAGAAAAGAARPQSSSLTDNLLNL